MSDLGGDPLRHVQSEPLPDDVPATPEPSPSQPAAPDLVPA